MKDLLKKLLTFDGTIHKYVYLRKDEKGFYIEYAFCEGAPHDNRCLDWSHSYQPEARKRNDWGDELLAKHKKNLDENIGKLYYLSSFTCGGEEDQESQIKKHREVFEKHHLEEKFHPENFVCKVGKPAPQCRKCVCPHWTYEEPVKCACWCLSLVEDIEKISFHFNVKTIQKFLDKYSKDSK